MAASFNVCLVLARQEETIASFTVIWVRDSKLIKTDPFNFMLENVISLFIWQSLLSLHCNFSARLPEFPCPFKANPFKNSQWISVIFGLLFLQNLFYKTVNLTVSCRFAGKICCIRFTDTFLVMLAVIVTCIEFFFGKFRGNVVSAAGRSTPFTSRHCILMCCMSSAIAAIFSQLERFYFLETKFLSDSSSFVVPSFFTFIWFLPHDCTRFLGIRILKELTSWKSTWKLWYTIIYWGFQTIKIFCERLVTLAMPSC